MAEAIETLIYEMAFRLRLYIASKFPEDKRLDDLSEREALILELVGTMGGLSISAIRNFYPKVSSSTISTTITKLWKDRKLVESAVLNRLMQAPVQPVTVVTHKKPCCDADDMKVSLRGDRLVNIGKKLSADQVDAESIGMILFRGKGPLIFRKAVEKALQDAFASKKWYLSVIAQMARSMPVWAISAIGLQWCEIDYPADLKQAQKVVRTFSNAKPDGVDRYLKYAVG